MGVFWSCISSLSRQYISSSRSGKQLYTILTTAWNRTAIASPWACPKGMRIGCRTLKSPLVKSMTVQSSCNGIAIYCFRSWLGWSEYTSRSVRGSYWNFIWASPREESIQLDFLTFREAKDIFTVCDTRISSARYCCNCKESLKIVRRT